MQNIKVYRKWQFIFPVVILKNVGQPAYTQQTFYIGPMSGRYTFLHRADIGSHVGPISDVQHGSMSDRCRLHIKQ